MKMSEFMEQIKAVYKNYFPESYCHVTYDKNLYASVGIICCLAGNREEESGGYWENDMLHISFSVDNNGKEFFQSLGVEFELPKVLRLEKWHNSYMIIPEDKYSVYGRETVSFRRVTGNAEKIIKGFDAFCGRLHKSLEQSIKDGKIHEHYAMIVSKKVGVIG